MFVARSPEILTMDPVKVGIVADCDQFSSNNWSFSGESSNVCNDQCDFRVPHLLEFSHDRLSTDHHDRSQVLNNYV